MPNRRRRHASETRECPECGRPHLRLHTIRSRATETREFCCDACGNALQLRSPMYFVFGVALVSLTAVATARSDSPVWSVAHVAPLVFLIVITVNLARNYRQRRAVLSRPIVRARLGAVPTQST